MALPQTQQDTKVISDAWDYKGRPALRSTSGGWSGAAMILGVEAVERLVTLGIAVNLVVYLTKTMHLGNASAANIVTNFMGTSYILTLLGGYIADTFLGRYLTVGIGATVQAIGATILTISTIIPNLRPPKCDLGSSSCIPADGKQLAVLFTALYMIALGTGCLKSSVSGFGTDQFDESDPKEKGRMIKFFSWFFFLINVGALIAVTVLVYIQDKVGRQWGYGICACAIVAGLVLFLSGTRKYRFKKLVGSPLAQFASVFVAAWRKRHLKLPSDSSALFNIEDIVGDEKNKDKQKLPHSKEFRFLDKAAIKDSDSEFSGTAILNDWNLATLTDVEEVKLVIRMLPTWATTIMFWTVYAQMTTFSVSQATTMDRHIGKSFEIPPASLTAFFVGSIMVVIVFYDRIVVPLCARYLNNPHGFTPLTRIAIGIVMSIIAMIVAALTEIKRLNVAQSQGLTNNQNAVIPMSVFWLVPQFLLVGGGEAVTYIGQLDFFLRECPKGMKTMSTGLFISTISLGFFFSSILVSIVDKVTVKTRPWLADNLNQGKLSNFYWLLAILSVLNMMLFFYSAKRYVYKEKRLAEVGIQMENSGPACH
ncbi:hypothetical protein K7X08_006069 [Anisodus acutangulus]|uniref:Uncharacterized protein n=1 Tax=Anisodus acutangulus TaxID=402998 RepID=A0A9Q1R7S4_9SOLA|nr:hypothetical protein K7X08_006069 [Anisodus acutangulus]